MNIYITGVAGFLGSNLADSLLKLGHTVYGCDNLIGGSLDNVSENVIFYNLDCCDLSELSKTMKNIDIVYHCAATAHEGLSIFCPDLISKNVFGGTVATATSAIQNKVKRFIYCSSMSRYGNIVSPFNESDEPNPVNPYGIAKLAAEKVLQSLCVVHGMEYNIAVPHNIIGPKQCYTDPFRNVLSIIINRILMGKSPMVYGDGEQIRCFSYVDDCISCLIKMGLDPSIKNEIFNIGPDEEFVSINKLIEIICKELNFSGESIYVKPRPLEVKIATCNSDKARKYLGYKTNTDLVTAIRNTINYIKSKGPEDFNYKYNLEINNDFTPETWKNKLI